MTRRTFLRMSAALAAMAVWPWRGQANPPAWPMDFKGPFTQGGLVQGTTLSGTRLRLDESNIPVSYDGRFLLGFGRDQGSSALLTIVTPDGAQLLRNLLVQQRQYDIQRIDGLPPATVTPDPATAERIAAERARIKMARLTWIEAPYYLSGFVWPAAGVISGVYGSQRILNGEPRQPHFGVDVAAGEGAPVLAPADGIVGLAEADLFLTGGTIILNHGGGLCSDFLHLSRLTVQEGQQVKQGTVIGAVGKTGRATGPHLHWGMTLGETRLDPQLLVAPMPTAKAG